MKKPLEYLSEKEVVFKYIADKFRIAEIPIRPQGSETLVLLVLEEQVSIDSEKVTF